MANTFQREAIDGGDSGIWADPENKQNRRSLGRMTAQIYDDSGTLKVSVGRIGFDNGSNKGTIIVDTITTISMAGVSNANWAKIEVSVSGTTPTFAAADIAGATDPASLPGGFTGSYDSDKGGFYITGTKRVLGLAWKNTGGTLEGLIVCESNNESYISSGVVTDDASDFPLTHRKENGILTLDDINSGITDQVGHLYYFLAENRPGAAILASGSATSFTDVDFSSYVPQGTKAVLVYVKIALTGDGALDFARAEFRENGSSESDANKTLCCQAAITNLGAGLVNEPSFVMPIRCSTDGIIEYKVNDANAGLSLFLRGYYI